jgi:hypothetical protein
MEQILARMSAEMNATEERMEAKIKADNEKFEVFQGTLVSRMDNHQAITDAIKKIMDTKIKEMKAGQEHPKEEIKARIEEMKEKSSQAEMKSTVSAIQEKMDTAIHSIRSELQETI